MIQNITILVPLYNEEEVFPELMERLDRLILTSGKKINVLLIDDGSSDQTQYIIQKMTAEKENYSAIFLSKNFGHSMALTAGLAEMDEETDAVLIMDADLQDPPELLETFCQKMEEGYDVVFGIRKKRKEGIWKKICYKVYYRLQKRFSAIKMPLDAGDFSLVNRNVVIQMNRLQEQSRYIRGLRSWVGFKQTGIEYEREQRHSGKTKYSMPSLIKLALNGIFNFSELPIRFISIIGFITIFFSLIYLGLTLYKRVVFGTVPQGFTTLIFAIVLFSGVQMLSLGIIGEYVLRIFFQVKQRPLFIVKSRIIKGKFNPG